MDVVVVAAAVLAVAVAVSSILDLPVIEHYTKIYKFLVHGQVIHYFRSVCLFVCLFVCLCRVFLSRVESDFDQTWTYVVCLGLVVSLRR